MIGLGRMGSNMVRRLLGAGHDCVYYDRSMQAVSDLAGVGGRGTTSVSDLVAALSMPRAIWLMVPAGAVDSTLEMLEEHLGADDIVIDGGNSHYVDAIRRTRALADRGIHFVDVGTSGGVWGLERGYCLMIGGANRPVQRLDPIFAALAPGPGDVAPAWAGST